MEQNAAFATSISLHKRKRGHGSSTYVEQTFEPEQELLEALAQTRMERTLSQCINKLNNGFLATAISVETRLSLSL